MGVIVGIDEVGRGCWAGPLVAAAVVLNNPIDGLTDSKLLTSKRRRELALEIEQTSHYGLGWVWPNDIDTVGLTKSVTIAMVQALSLININYDEIIIDGSYNFIPDQPNVRTMVKADFLIPSVSAASIIAKAARDLYMAEQSLKFPGYGFESHVGYGTKKHIAAIKQLGVCKIHRISYKPIKNLVNAY